MQIIIGIVLSLFGLYLIINGFKNLIKFYSKNKF